jgi:6-phosphogluconolactonase (cycloisomerase 2 family)
MKKPTFLLFSFLISFQSVISQVQFLEARRDGEGGIEGLMEPEKVILNSTGNEIYLTAFRCITHLRKTNKQEPYEFVETIHYSSDVYPGLGNASELKMGPNGKFIYLMGDENLNTFKINTDGTIAFLERIQSTDELTIGNASCPIAITTDNRNLYLGASSNKPVVHIFSIDQVTGKLNIRHSLIQGWNLGEQVSHLAVSPSNQFLYVLASNSFADSRLLVFKRVVERDSLELIQSLGKSDSIDQPSDFIISPDNKHLYVIECKKIKTFDINSSTGTLSYVDELYVSDFLEKTGCIYSEVLSKDNNYLYLGTDYSLAVIKCNTITGELSFIQNLALGDYYPDGAVFFNSMALADDDSLLYVTDKFNDRLRILRRNSVTGELAMYKNLVNLQGKTGGLKLGQDLLVTHDNTRVIVLANSGVKPMAIFERNINGLLKFKRNLSWSELGPGAGSLSSFSITPDDKFLYVTTSGSYNIRLLARNQTSLEFALAGSYTIQGTALTSERSIVEGELTQDGKYFYSATPTEVLTYSLNPDDGQLTYKSIYSLQENSSNGFPGIKSVTISPDNNFMYICSQSEFYPSGITVLQRNQSNGSLTFFQKIADMKISKILVSNDDKYVYGLGDEVYCFAVDSISQKLKLIDQIDIEGLGYSQVYKLDDGIITYDNRALIAVSTQGKAIMSFYRNSKTGKISLEEVKYYSPDRFNAMDGPKIKMSPDMKNVYIISPYDAMLCNYTANVPLGLEKTTGGCSNDKVMLAVDEGYNYLWSNGEKKNQINTTVPGIFTVYVTDSLGREGWDTTNVVIHESPTISITLDSANTTWFLRAYFFGGQVPVNVTWYNGAHSYSIPVNESQVYNGKKFWVRITDDNGCVDHDTLTVGSETPLNEITGDEFFIISPNPVSDVMRVNMNQPSKNNLRVELYNAKGDKIYSTLVEAHTTAFKINMGDYSPGMYALKVSSGDKNGTVKIMKQ